jgi:hypothetical protein
VAGAVLIDANSLQVFHADTAGRFTIPYCSSLDQFWVASWLIPLGTSYRAPFGKPGSAGGSTTYFGPPPTTPGPGYARLDRLWPQAVTTPAPCQGQPVDVKLPAGGGVDITWMSKPLSGTPSVITGPVTGYYEILPGLPYNAGTYMPTTNSSGHQIMQQLGAGGMAVNSSSSRFTCQGGGIQATSGSSWQVPIVAGQTAQVTCTVP